MVDMKEGRHVIVSGGSRGLGASLVGALLEKGYFVSAFSRSPTDFTKSLNKNTHCLFGRADSSKRETLEKFVRSAVRCFGSPYGLINCSGVAYEGVLASMDPNLIDQILSTNLAGTLHLTRIVAREMLLRPGGGSIVMISSIIGLRGYSGLASYAATKGGMDAAMRALARELGRRQVRVNSVAPGYLETEMTHGVDETQRNQIIRRTPLNRLGLPDDVVGLVLFLLSEKSRFITGQTIAIDGGITC